MMDIYYTLSEAAELTGLYPQYLLRIMDQYGDIIKPQRKKRSSKAKYEQYMFSQDDIKDILAIRWYQERGISLGEAVQQLSVDKKNPFSNAELEGFKPMLRMLIEHIDFNEHEDVVFRDLFLNGLTLDEIKVKYKLNDVQLNSAIKSLSKKTWMLLLSMLSKAK